MKARRLSTAFKISVVYFLLVLLVLFWFESSLGKTEYSGLVPGLLLVFITMPSSLFGGSVADLFQCATGSFCEHLTATLFSGGLNTVGIYAVLRALASAFNHRDKA